MRRIPTIDEAYYEGLPDWYIERTPAYFWTREAFALFAAARRAGLIDYFELADIWTAGPNIGKGALAYFCQKASKYLRLNNGSHTCWKPFEIMFNPSRLNLDTPPGALPDHIPAPPLRLALHNLEESAGQEAMKDRIDNFFSSFQSKTTKTL